MGIKILHSSETYVCQRCGRKIPIGEGCNCLISEIKSKMEVSKKEQE